MNKDQVVAWKAAAIADGWKQAPISRNEEADTWCELRKDGFVAQVVTRPAGSLKINPKHEEYEVSLWGPDGLAVTPPEVYSMQAVIDGLSVCASCHCTGETVRIGFAGRVCPACREKLAPKIEYPGWCS